MYEFKDMSMNTHYALRATFIELRATLCFALHLGCVGYVLRFASHFT